MVYGINKNVMSKLVLVNDCIISDFQTASQMPRNKRQIVSYYSSSN